jgi:hypothetical protein
VHDTRPDGTVIASYCDFCRASFDDHPMIEGHQGSLLCLNCLSAAYTDVVLAGGGTERAGGTCTMCLESRDQPQWKSPAVEGPRLCLRCIKQSATALEKDPEVGWKRPRRPDGTSPEVGDGIYT